MSDIERWAPILIPESLENELRAYAEARSYNINRLAADYISKSLDTQKGITTDERGYSDHG